MKNITLVCLALFCVSCHRSAAPGSTAKQARESTVPPAVDAHISASPNPIKGGPEEGTTTITWDSQREGSLDVYVSRNGAPEQLFGSGKSGSKTVHWIRQGLKYQFALYEHVSHKLLGQVQVTHQQ